MDGGGGRGELDSRTFSRKKVGRRNGRRNILAHRAGKGQIPTFTHCRSGYPWWRKKGRGEQGETKSTSCCAKKKKKGGALDLEEEPTGIANAQKGDRSSQAVIEGNDPGGLTPVSGRGKEFFLFILEKKPTSAESLRKGGGIAYVGGGRSAPG